MMNEREEKIKLAQKVKEACVQAAREGFEDASMRGLCNEGAVEAAIGHIQSLKMEQIIEEAKS